MLILIEPKSSNLSVDITASLERLMYQESEVLGNNLGLDNIMQIFCGAFQNPFTSTYQNISTSQKKHANFNFAIKVEWIAKIYLFTHIAIRLTKK